jgi:signal transduction histidine kinase
MALGPVIARVVRAFARSARGEALRWDCELTDGIAAEIQEADFVELLGTICDNASKWAVSSVRVSLRQDQAMILLVVEDDGPGIAPQDRRAVLSRGIQLNTNKSGTGLGLAMAHDIATAYRGTIRLDSSALGGLCVEIKLPRQGA